jgi:hypothetical protein
MSVPAFADTTIGDWEGTESGTSQYEGTQAGTAAAGMSANGIVYSRHNLSSYGEHYQATNSVTGTSTATGIMPNAVLTTEICVFCHTPHFGQTGTAPIWNRGSSATGYTAYGTTVAGTSITTVGGSSLACLSCHDGVTTLDNLINKPGKGSRTNGTGADMGWVFGEIGTGDTIGDTTAGGDVPGGATKGASRLNIGADNAASRNAANIDLSNDHPINVVYAAGTAASLRATSTVISSLVMDNARSNASDSTRDIYGRSDNLWASRGFISSTATISEILRDGGKVQCGSCHDPHYKNQTNTDPAVVASYGAVAINHVDSDGLFLRRVGGNSNSGVCRTCHGK